VRFFREKMGVTPSVAAPGDTNPSEATDLTDTKKTLHSKLQTVCQRKQ